MSLLVDIIHVFACVGLILVVLMQAGKGAGMGAAFGGSSQTVFGSAGATTFMVKVTRWLALIFIVTSLAITIMSGGKTSSSVMSGVAPAASQAEAAPEPTVPTTPIQNQDNAGGAATPANNGGQ